MYKVQGLRKTAKTEPEQDYELILNDLGNTKTGYCRTTEYGTETQIRAMLKNGGLTDSEIDILFERAR